MKCKNCGKEIHKIADGSMWGHEDETFYCNFDMAEPEQTEAERDVEELRTVLKEFHGPGLPAYASLYRTVIRLAEKVGI